MGRGRVRAADDCGFDDLVAAGGSTPFITFFSEPRSFVIGFVASPRWHWLPSRGHDRASISPTVVGAGVHFFRRTALAFAGLVVGGGVRFGRRRVIPDDGCILRTGGRVLRRRRVVSSWRPLRIRRQPEEGQSQSGARPRRVGPLAARGAQRRSGAGAQRAHRQPARVSRLRRRWRRRLRSRRTQRRT